MRVGLFRYIALLLVLFFAGLSSAEKSMDAAAPNIDPKKWEPAVALFELYDKAFPNPAGGIVFVGSSSFKLWNDRLRTDMSPLEVIPRGFGGSTIVDVLHYADRLVVAYKPRAVVLYQGENDISFGFSPEEVRDNFELFTKKMAKDLPGTRIYILSIKPSILRKEELPKQNIANRLLKELCESNNILTYIDIATPMFGKDKQVRDDLFIDDNLHMNKKGYEIWRSVVKSVLQKNENVYESK